MNIFHFEGIAEQNRVVDIQYMITRYKPLTNIIETQQRMGKLHASI